MIRRRSVSFALLGLLFNTTACTSYKQIELGEVMDHDRVRVTTTDGTVRDLYEPKIQADSIRGRVQHDSQITYSIPLDQVSDLKTGGTQAAATILTIIGVSVLVFLLAFGASDAGEL